MRLQKPYTALGYNGVLYREGTLSLGSRVTPMFPAPHHLSPFSPPNCNRSVDSPAFWRRLDAADQLWVAWELVGLCLVPRWKSGQNQEAISY